MIFEIGIIDNVLRVWCCFVDYINWMVVNDDFIYVGDFILCMDRNKLKRWNEILYCCGFECFLYKFGILYEILVDNFYV